MTETTQLKVAYYLKVMTNLDSVLKSRDIALLTKVHTVKAVVFPVAMYRCESWTIERTEHWRIGAFELCCWRRLSRVPCTVRSNQSILKEISPEYSLEGPMPKLKLQYFGHLMPRTDSLEKMLMLGKIEGRKRMRWQEDEMSITNSTQWTWVWANSESWWWIVKLACYCPWDRKESDMTEQLNWTDDPTLQLSF